jgi:phospholipase C
MLHRRAVLQGLGTLAIGCGHDAADDATSIESSETKAEPTLSPKELLAGIEHIVVAMMENRSFDHYLGALSSDASYASSTTVDGLEGTEQNPAPDGTSVPVFKLATFTAEDPPHEWDEAHAQFNGGKNDGFVKAHAGDFQKEVMGYYDRSQIPLYYWFADNFAVCDHWFSSVMGPTWPNRFYLHATTSKGKKNNTPIFNGPKRIWDALKDKNVSAKNYAAGITTWVLGGFPGTLFDNPSAKLKDFFAAAKNGTLPAFSIIDPDFSASDDHPAHDILRGQAFVASIYKALADSPAWSKTLLIVTYDENGGFFDHVPPPKTIDDNPEFTQLGFRVPAFVIGPTVKKGYVCKTQLEHVSVAATAKTRWDIASLSKRMDATNDVTDCIDPAKVNAPAAPPPGMPQIAMSMTLALSQGIGESSQPMLEELVDQGIAPIVNSKKVQERVAEWLEEAVRVGAVRIVGN